MRIESELGEALVTDRYTYALYDEGENRQQLYDLEIDPGQTRNHVDDNPKIGADLHERLVSGSQIR